MSDLLLASCIALTQLLSGLMGIHLAARPREDRHHWRWILGFLLIGLAGIVLITESAWRTSDFQNAEKTALTQAQFAAQKARDEAAGARKEQRIAQQMLRKQLDKVGTETRTSIAQSEVDSQTALKQLIHPPRVLSVEQEHSFVKLLQNGGPWQLALYSGSDKESQDFAQQLVTAMGKAGWKVQVLQSKASYDAFGLTVVLKDLHKVPRGALALINALQFIGLRVKVARSTREVPDTYCLVIVGLNYSGT